MRYEPNSYLAFELSPTSRGELLKTFPPVFEKVICHHITVLFKPTEEEFNDVFEQLNIRLSPLEVIAVGYSKDASLECISITVNGESKRPREGYYHVTLSLGPGRKPVESNKLLAVKRGVPDIKLEQPLKLKGTLNLLKL